MMKKLRILFVLGLIIVSSSAVQAKKYRLTYNLKVGTEFTMLHTMEQDIIQEVMGQSQVMKNIYTTRYVFKVLEEDADGNYLIEEQIDGVKMKMENDFQNMDYDSDRDGESPGDLKALTSGMNIPLKFLLSKTGKVIEITDAEEFLAKMKEALGDDSNPMAQMASGMASQITTTEGLRNQLDGFFFNYPDQKIKKGEVWTAESQSTQMVKFKNVIENTLAEADKEKVTIKQEVSIEQMELSEGMEMQGMTISYELSGRKDAGHQLDLASGLAIRVDGVTEISGIVSIESPQLPTPMSIPMTLKLTEIFERVN